MPEPAETKRKITLLWVVESLSTASGIAFLASAIAHATAFHMTWGLNYFAVASPTDVVMGAFNPLLMVLGPALAILMIAVVATVIMNVVRQGPRAAFDGIFQRTVGLFTPLRLLGLSLVALAAVVAFSDVFVPRPGRPPSWLYTGLAADAPECPGAPVQWLGSQSAILDCGGSVRIERRDALKLRVSAG
ncbi:hypothetical protein IP78_04410 [Brevundimonas sp. AAP58]|uniref:hypothetical protein n=1 Tax=Brevundimonas sp. AAP58 TaxID=1523422 RepID=UPI0006B94E88|nr:hypothetical protein [Brevundimonas sp. AAP58]KPF82172.1 hypothetical protein IP78_04410 [Brevundimonas sp. AAP58]